MEVDKFLGHGRREGQWIVGIDCNPHTGLVQHAERMRRHRGHHARPHVAGGADVEHHPGLCQMHDECRVLHGSHTVGDALHVELAQTIPDAGRPSALASVGPAAQPRLRCQAEGCHEWLRAGERLLIAVQVYADNRGTTVAGGHCLLNPLAGES